MSEDTFLNGKVRKRSLPAFELPLAVDAPTVKRLLLPQGELAQFYDADEGVRYLAFIELRPGTVRGNHYHKSKEEWVYIIGGEAVLIVEDIQSKERQSVPMRTGGLAVIATGIAHAIKVEKAGQAVEFSPARFDASDIHKYPLA
jgi:quercetin dioxygenase-like cupin family protein